MKIAVASPPYPKSLADALHWVEKLIQDAAKQQAEIICFPETYLPGYPGLGSETVEYSAEELQSALDQVCNMARRHSISVVIPMDWYKNGRKYNVAQVISGSGVVLGCQTKNQLDPSEDNLWESGTDRMLFEVKGVKFGVTICHEGFRYPESVRWAARHGAKVVFHPNCTGSDSHGKEIKEWGNKDSPYYEKAQMMRALENTIYFASCNYAFKYAESASSIVSPDGSCITFQPYGEVGIAVAEIDEDKATGLLAKRFKAFL